MTLHVIYDGKETLFGLAVGRSVVAIRCLAGTMHFVVYLFNSAVLSRYVVASLL